MGIFDLRVMRNLYRLRYNFDVGFVLVHRKGHPLERDGTKRLAAGPGDCNQPYRFIHSSRDKGRIGELKFAGCLSMLRGYALFDFLCQHSRGHLRASQVFVGCAECSWSLLRARRYAC